MESYDQLFAICNKMRKALKRKAANTTDMVSEDFANFIPKVDRPEN